MPDSVGLSISVKRVFVLVYVLLFGKLQKLQDSMAKMTTLADVLADENGNESSLNNAIHVFQGAETMKTQTTQKKAVRELKSLRTEAANKKAADRHRCCRCCRCCRSW